MIKTLMTWTLLLFCGLAYAADPSVELNLTSSLQWDHNGHDSHHKSAKCNIFGKGDTDTSRGRQTQSSRAVVSLANSDYSLANGFDFAGQWSQKNVFTFQSRTKETGDVTAVSLSVSQAYDASIGGFEKEHDCHKQFESGRPVDVKLDGTISFVFPLEQGISLVRAKRSQFSAVNITMNSENLVGFSETIEQVRNISKPGEWVYLWGRPGTDVRLNFKMNNVMGLKTFNEEYAVQFAPVVVTKPSLEDLKAVMGMGTLGVDAGSDPLEDPAFLSMVKLASWPDQTRTLLSSLSIMDTGGGMEALKKLESDFSSALTLRQMNYLVGAKILQALVQDALATKVVSYCKSEDVQVAKGGSVKVMGAIYGQVMYSRAVWSAQFYDFSRYNVYFRELQELQARKMTYAAAILDPNLGPALKKAVRALTISFQESSSAGYHDVEFYLGRLVQRLPSLNSGSSSFESLFAEAGEAKKQQEALYAEYQRINAEFRNRSTSVINVSKAVSLLRDAEKMHVAFLRDAYQNKDLIHNQLSPDNKISADSVDGLQLLSALSFDGFAVTSSVEQQNTVNRIAFSFLDSTNSGVRSEVRTCIGQ